MSYHNILVAIDIYEPFQDYLKEVKQFAALQQAKIHCVYVIPNITTSVPYAYDFERSIEQEAHETLAKIKNEISCEPHILKGIANISICSLAKKIQADLIICGSHGRHGLELILGATANGILHNAECDILTIRINKQGSALTPIVSKNIVVAVNLHADSKKVVVAAKELAEKCQSSLHIVHAVSYVSASAAAYYPEIEKDLKKEAEQKMLELSQDLTLNQLNSEIYVDTPRQAVLKAADRHNAELIVVGSQSKSAITSALLGSTANAVLHYAKCNVLVVRL
jgi:universal stress protein A